MLFSNADLEGLRAGTVTRAYRRWTTPRAKAGGRQRTKVGVLAVTAVEQVRVADITAADARAAGCATKGELLKMLAGRPGRLYRIDLEFAGEDPRIELRNRIATGDELETLRARLAGIDRRSPTGPWTAAMLELIRDNEGVRAPDLAAREGRETAPFKRAVRKLKELGLTESLEVGYRLSPRGRAYLAGR